MKVEGNHNRRIQIINKVALLITCLVALVAILIMIFDQGTKGKDFGPGSYYYSDIPGWQKIFYPEVKD